MIDAGFQRICDLLAGLTVDVVLLDAEPSRSLREAPPAPPGVAPRPPLHCGVTFLVSVHGEHSAAHLAQALRIIDGGAVQTVEGQTVTLRVKPMALEEKARLWRALVRPFAPGFVIEAGPVKL